MTLILVAHDTAEPALYGAMAAIVARERGAALAHPPVAFEEEAGADAKQHVAAAGALVASGLVWLERLTGAAVAPETTIEALLEQARRHDLVVPHHPRLAMNALSISRLIERAEQAGIAVEYRRAREEGLLFRFDDEDATGVWERDRFGRLHAAGPGQAPQSPDGPALRVALVGRARDHRQVYPAALAALGDAADAERLALEVAFVPPQDVRERDADAILHEADGLLLPGGSDMANVPGQISMAHAALRLGMPTVGLCLGMQTMATAVAQKALGSGRVNLAEADPRAPVKSFVALSGEAGEPLHRLGERSIVTVPGSRVAAWLGPQPDIRCNHRFHLNRALLPALEGAGLTVSAHDGSGAIADAIELSGHPFYVGMQGHPELSANPSEGHPLLRAFLRACRKRRAGWAS